MYKVIKDFTDLRDNRHIYRVGDEYPHSGVRMDKDRIRELSGDENTFGEPVIKELEIQAETPKKKERKKNVRADSGVHT